MQLTGIMQLDLTWSGHRLYAMTPDAERLFISPSQAVRDLLDQIDPARLPWTDRIFKYTVLPRGESGANRLPTGAELAEEVVERFGDDCGDEYLFENYETARNDPKVIAAFDAALDALKSKQTYLMADREVGVASVTIRSATDYDISEWEMSPRVRQ